MKHLIYSCLVLSLALGCRQANTPSEQDTQTTDQIAATKKQNSHCSPKTTDKDWYTTKTKAPKFKGLEGINFKITTDNPEAQLYFNQGMMLSYAFNHAEAARSFYESTRIDPKCAMCYWGYAYVLGPNYNAGMEEDNFERAYVAAQKAKSLAKNSTEKEQALIEALTFRYAENPPEDRSPLDHAYSTAMKKTYQQFMSDPDIGALYAESLMDLHPWDLYEKNSRKPKPWTPELVKVLEHLMSIHPRHPGAHHFYIHAVEASNTPERGMNSAKLFETLVPGAGHLVHMPAHIYIRTGDYHRGTIANINAVRVDSNYMTACHAQGAYPLAYYPHNYHFLAATATLEGNSKVAWRAAKMVQINTAEDVMKQPGWGTLQHFYTIPYYVAVKFALWDTILSVPMPEENLIYPRSVLHYARGMAFLGKGDLAAAEKELALLHKLAADTSLKSITIWDINSTYELMQIAVYILSGEIERQKKEFDKAISFFEKAVAIEGSLYYDEPPDWFFSVRHHLGEALLDAGKFAEAEKTYNEDLITYPENGWALIGLHQAMKLQDKQTEAQQVKLRFDNAWQYADISIKSSSSL